MAARPNRCQSSSRGLSPKQLVDSKLWWEGPHWLVADASRWPNLSSWRSKTVESEQPQCHTLSVEPPPDILIRRFSGYKKMLRVLSWARRFIRNSKLKQEERTLTHMTELQTTEVLLLKQRQQRSFPQESNCLDQKKPMQRTSSIS